MGTSAEELSILLKAQAQTQQAFEDARRQLAALNTETGKLRDSSNQLHPAVAKVSGVFGDIGTQVKATALGFVSAQAIIGGVTAAFHTMADFVSSSIQSFAASEAASKRLATALKAQGTATPAVIHQFDDMAASFQNTTTYADDLISEMQSLLVQVGNVMPSQMQDALKASTDLASGLGIDLRDATMLVAKAFSGGGDELGRLKVILGDTVHAGEGMAGILSAIEEKFGGQAQSEIETYAGKVKQLANAWDDVKEAVGRSIVEDPLLIAAMRELTDAVKQGSSAAEDAAPTFVELWASFAGVDTVTMDLIKATEALTGWYQTVAHPPKAPNLTTPQRPMQFGQQPIDVSKYLTEEAEAQKKAAAATQQHTDAIAALRRELSGAGAIKAANDLLEALRKMPPIQKLTAENQTRVNKVMGEALDALNALGKGDSSGAGAIRAVYQETFRLTDTIPLINRWKDSLAHSADGILQLKTISDKLAHDTWPTTIAGLEHLILTHGKLIASTKTLGETMKANLLATLEQIPQTIASAFTGGGGVGGAIKATASMVGSAIGSGIGTTIGGPVGGAIGSAIGSLAGPAVGALGKLLGIGPTEYEKRMRAAATETKTLQQNLIASHGSMQQLIIDADLVGINIKEAFNWRDPEAFKNIVNDVDQKTQLLNSAMEEYGFTWEDLGEKARGAKMTELFDELFAKTDILRTAGIDYHTVLERQSKDYSDLVQAAKRTGSEIPAAMEPVLQDLVDIGLLVDENGDKLTDLKDIKWSKTMTDGFKDVTDAIHELTDALTNGVGGALDSLGKRVVHVPIKFDVDGTPTTDGLPGYARGTRGEYVDFGAGTPVMLHGRERVVTEAEGRGSSQPIVVQSIIQVDGREIARANARYQRSVLAPYGVR